MSARPATRHLRERQAPDPAVRAPVRDLTRGSQSFRINWDVRPAYDFVFSLSDTAGSTDDLPTADRTWLAEAKAALPQDVQSAAKLLFDSLAVAVVVIDRPAIRTADDVVAAIGSMDPREMIRAMFEEPEQAALVDRAMAGDDSVLPALEETMPEDKREARLQILREPEQTVADLRSGAGGVVGAIHADRIAGRRDPRARLRRPSRPTGQASRR